MSQCFVYAPMVFTFVWWTPQFRNAVITDTYGHHDIPNGFVEGKGFGIFIDVRNFLRADNNVKQLTRDHQSEWFSRVSKLQSFLTGSVDRLGVR